MAERIVYPIYFLPVKKKETAWYFDYGRNFYNRDSIPVPDCDRESMYGLTKKEIIVELFRIAAGRAGYYLVNMRDKKYYYCGSAWEDIRLKLRELGIGRDEPNYPEVD